MAAKILLTLFRQNGKNCKRPRDNILVKNATTTQAARKVKKSHSSVEVAFKRFIKSSGWILGREVVRYPKAGIDK